MSSDNAHTITQGLAHARQLIRQRLSSRLSSIGRKIGERELGSKEYSGFTGNAQTSYQSQVWSDGKKIAEWNSGDSQPDPIRPKIEEGDTVTLSEPYEGAPRSVRGKVEIEHPWGAMTLDAIERDKPDSDFLAIRLAVGVEYNDYIGDPIGQMMQSAMFDINERTLREDVRD